MLITIVFLILIITAVVIYFWLFDNGEVENNFPTIHQSGNFSIIRKSPRGEILNLRPSKNTLLENGLDKIAVEKYFQVLNENIKEIEDGDKKGVEFFIFTGNVPENLKNLYIKRKDIAENSDLVPPYNLNELVKIKSEFEIKKIIDSDKFLIDKINWHKNLMEDRD